MVREMISQISRVLPWRRQPTWRLVIVLLLMAGIFHLYLQHEYASIQMERSSYYNMVNVTDILIKTDNESMIKANNESMIKASDIFYSNLTNMLYKMVPLTDNTIYSNEKISEIIKQKHNNIPLQYLENSKFWTQKNHSCAKYPELFDLNYNNFHWQYLKTRNGSHFYVFSAFYDNRTHQNNKPVVRILTMINTLKPYVKPNCQFWFKGIRQPIFTKVASSNYIWYKEWGNYKENILQPYLFTCDIPEANKHQVPESVSLVENSCDNANTNIRVINNQPASGVKQDVAVCVKGLDHLRTDLSVTLVEWLELLNGLGVNKVILYELEVHPNVSKVLKYYQTTGFVDLIPMTLPGNQMNLEDLRHRFLKQKMTSKRQNELIPYNDCFYRNMNLYKYISLLDTDEIIMPLKDIRTWIELVDMVKKKDITTKERSSYVFRNVYVMKSMTEPHGYNPDIPPYMHMLRNVYRAFNYTKPGYYIKAFHNTDRILTLHNHFPFACVGGSCSSYSVDTDDGHLLHYREDCVGELMRVCPEFKTVTVRDENIWKYKEKTIKKTFEVLSKLGFFDYTVDIPYKVL